MTTMTTGNMTRNLTSDEHRGASRLLESIRQFLACWDEHNRYLPMSETEEELASRKAVADALGIVEGRAQWLETEMKLEQDRSSMR